jgi:hypothetical protein
MVVLGREDLFLITGIDFHRNFGHLARKQDGPILVMSKHKKALVAPAPSLGDKRNPLTPMVGS